MATALDVTHRSRFAVATSDLAPQEARRVASTILDLILTPTEAAVAVRRQVLACLAELVAIAFIRSSYSTHLLCELWRDSEHVIASVEHHEPLPLLPDETTLGLTVVRTLADDYGSHKVDGKFQMWAAVRVA
ncbi:hypothetical protein AB0H51_27855 [Streptomyces griseoluteus]|uniref:hypothetical protein n=1 Tax=Streptomyces griseoluteus TaxID=29306 RepID=UPI0033CA6882